MSNRIARMQRRAARRSVMEWATNTENAKGIRDGMLEQMRYARGLRRRLWAGVVAVLLSAVALLWWAVRS